MSGARLVLDIDGLARLAGWTGGMHRRVADLPDALGAMVESQTRRRIEEERTAPDGTPWPAWSKDYGATRHSGHALLQGEGDLVDSLFHETTSDGAEIGTGLVYGATHQFGREENHIPARPFLGLSPDNEAEITQLIADLVETAQ